jgi:protein involved in polysaccharide export with SLBB domain/capsular polysaccharide biosynthesis protein
MKENTDANAGEARQRTPAGHNGANGHSAHHGPSRPPVDIWVVFDVLGRRWHWLFLGACLFAGAFFYLGFQFIKPKYTASAQMRRWPHPPTVSEVLKPDDMTPETFVSLVRLPDLLTKVGDQAIPSIPAERLVKMIKVDPEADSQFVKITLAAGDPQTAVRLLNIYVHEAAEFTKEYQKKQVAQLAADNLNKQVSRLTNELAAVQEQFRHVAAPATVSNKLSEIRSVVVDLDRLNKAKQELDGLLAKFTDIHPAVVAKREEIADLKRKIESSTNQPPATATVIDTLLNAQAPNSNASIVSSTESDIIRIKLLSLEEAKTRLITIQTEADGILENPSGYAEVSAEANMQTVQRSMQEVKIAAATVVGGGLGIGLSLLLVLLVEVTDRRLHNIDDVRRVTRLPVLTSLGDLNKMKQPERAQWAFRSWTILQGRLSPTANHGLVCGITSSSPGEGRSTWIRMLAEAASLTGFRVLTISTRPTGAGDLGQESHDQLADLDPQAEARSDDPTVPYETSQDYADERGPMGHDSQDSVTMKGDPSAEEANGGNGKSSSALANSVLSAPSQVTEKFNGPNSQPMVHIPLPGWVWNLERRKQWRDALTQWRSIENLVILVELPPACVAEAVLLGCNLPNLVWLTECGRADAGETRTQLDILRHARCNLVGAVLNREGSSTFRRRFPRWVEAMAAVLMLGGVFSLNAQQAPAPAPAEKQVELAAAPPATAPAANLQNEAAADAGATASPSAAEPAPITNGNFSISSPTQRAAWQQHLTLGAGDVLNFGLYGQPDMTRTEVTVSPDGTVTYLQAKDIPVTGLTIDELRQRLDKELAQWYRAPRTIVTPVMFRSKRYYMLGKVMTKGVYVLDRPITVLEAIARAPGFEHGLLDRNVIDIADLQRSFLVRNGKRYPINFEKLFEAGDLNQNVAIEPNDYLYFPSTAVKEVYVVGEVRLPGTVDWNSGTTIMAAISARGGYTDRAYKMRVLVVRGSLNTPEKIVVNTHAILDGEEPDFKLQPRDIVYVNSRPFIRVEELLDLAITAFLQSIVTEYVGVDLVKPVSD